MRNGALALEEILKRLEKKGVEAETVLAAPGLIREESTLPHREDAPIPLDMPLLPKFPTDVLPSWLNDMVFAVARHTETPPELAAMMGLATLAACCHGSFVVELKPGYREPLNLWTVAALESGNRKTSVMQHMTKPLKEKEREWCEAGKADIVRIETERENTKAQVKNLRAKLSRPDSEDYEDLVRQIHQLESSMPESLVLRRLWVQDITPEKLGQMLADNNERIAILADEGGIFDIIAGRYSNGVPNLDVFLQAHAGSAIRVDRGNRPPVVLNQPALTVGLSPQPEVLRGLSQKPGFRSRGLLARFLYAVPTSLLGYRKLHNEPIPPAVEAAYRTHLLALLSLQAPSNRFGETEPFIIQLAHASYEEWKAFALKVEAQMREGGELCHIRDWAGKLPGSAARLAGLFHCAQYAGEQPESKRIELGTMQAALGLAALLTQHALAVFDMMGADTGHDAARKVWNWVDSRKVETFTARDCFQALRGTFPRMADLNPALEVLLDRGYLTEPQEQNLGNSRRRRAKRVFVVNHLLVERWS